MDRRNFKDLLENRWNEGRFLCVGLDPYQERLPECVRYRSPVEGFQTFFRSIVRETAHVAAAFTLNVALYQAIGRLGIDGLSGVIQIIHEDASETPVILDTRFGGDPDTNTLSANWAFRTLGADAVTVQPYVGVGALQPFLNYANKGVFVLCRTSDSGSSHMQNVRTQTATGEKPYHQHVAQQVRDWNVVGNCGVVADTDVQQVRTNAGNGVTILIPSVNGAVRNLVQVVQYGMNHRGNGFLINAGSQICYASKGHDYAAAARIEADRLDREIRRIRSEYLGQTA